MEQKQKAVLVGANINNNEDYKNSMEELSRLAEACDIEVTGEISQNLNKINTFSYFGKGKILEVSELIEEKMADMAIFNDELSPSQIRNLEKSLECRVIDRTVLILDIFAERAKTKEAQLQVEIAQLKYMLPRIIGGSTSLGRQGGGSGLKNKGSGEKKLELDRRKLEDRISVLDKELEILVSRRQNQRKMRKKNEVPVVALVGYTNAGKSTVMNGMLDMYHLNMEKQVFEKDMLFATLETSVRNIILPDNKSFLLTDTVGFISKLPHHLVKAFRSTLEEVAEADLLIHVVDYSNPNYNKQIEVTRETLKELGADSIPVIYAFNKIDLAVANTETEKLADGTDDCLQKHEVLGELIDGTDVSKQKHEAFRGLAAESDDSLQNQKAVNESDNMERVFISAKKKSGMEQLTEKISDFVFKDYVQLEILLPYTKGNVVSYLNENVSIKSSRYENDGIWFSLECSRADYEKLKQYEIIAAAVTNIKHCTE